MAGKFKSMLYKFINEYAQVYEDVIKTQNFKHSFGLFVRNEIPKEIREQYPLNSELVAKKKELHHLQQFYLLKFR